MATRLAPLTPALRVAIAEIEVTDEQRGYRGTPSFAAFLAEAPQHPTFEVRAILDDARCVGFLSAGHEPNEPRRRWIPLVVVDRAAQGRGHGRAALEVVIAEARAAGATPIGLSYHPRNLVEAWLVLQPA